MHEQVIDLAHPRRTVLLRLLRILKPKRVRHVHFAILLEGTMQVVRNLVLGRGTGSLASIEVEGLVRVRFRDHLERMAGVRNADRRRTPSGMPVTVTHVRATTGSPSDP